MDDKERAIYNVWIERFLRTMKLEHMYLWASYIGHDLHSSIKTFVHYYNNQLKHSSLNYRTPANVYYAQATCEQNDEITLNQPNGAKLSNAYTHVKVKLSGLLVKKSKERSIFFTPNLDMRSAISMQFAKRFEYRHKLDKHKNADNRRTVFSLNF